MISSPSPRVASAYCLEVEGSKGGGGGLVVAKGTLAILDEIR